MDERAASPVIVPSARFWAWWVGGSLFLSALASAFVIDGLMYDVHTRQVEASGGPVAAELAISHHRLSERSHVFVPILGLTGLFWLLWQYRAHADLVTMRVPGLQFRPIWGVGSWFAPLANAFLPCLAVGELWKASDPEAADADWRSRRVTPLVWLWWLGWCATVALGVLGLISMWGSTTSNVRLMDRDRYFVAACGVLIVTALAAAWLIKLLNDRAFVKANRAGGPMWPSWRRATSRRPQG